jgi:hypothetical protein
MVSAHTYFIARRGRCEGVHKDRPSLAAALEALYSEGRGEQEPTAVDGASAWLDEGSSAHVRLVVGGVSVTVEAPEVRERFRSLLLAEVGS